MRKKRSLIFDSASRREFLKWAGGSVCALPILAACGEPSDGPAGGNNRDPKNPVDPDPAECNLTNEDPYRLGPYYRSGAPDRAALAPQGAPGEPLSISGRVFGGDCATPLEGALVEVWQADDGGAYDPSNPDYRYRAALSTNAAGEYAFSTVLPGAYNLGARFRPRHIHYRVSYGGEVLVTQLYFEGDPYLADDPGDEPSRTIPLTTGPSGKSGQFDIVLPV